jgi:ATP-binding cassette, subfamily B, bacterial
MASISLTQAFGREADEYNRFQTSVNRSVRAWLRLHWEEVCYGLAVSVIFGVGGAIVFGYGGYLVYRDQFLLHDPAGMTLGDLILFMTYLGMVYDPLCKLSGASGTIQQGVAGVERIFDVLDRNCEIAESVDASPLPRQPRTLTLDNVSFSYRSDRPLLQNVNAVIRPGELVAFVGASGVGKSTLLNLLPRFYDPVGGSIRLDGHDLRDIRLRDLRQHTALVLQEGVILPSTVAENIAYGRPNVTLSEIRTAAELAGASSFIEQLPNGYAERISEGGQNLSGGQRQRIAIARALLTEAPILVLDEPTSALDPHHERVITELLERLKGQRTIVVVSHRLSTVVAADQIFVMDHGRIVEQGTHSELLDLRGIYFAMAQHQLQLADMKPTYALAS